MKKVLADLVYNCLTFLKVGDLKRALEEGEEAVELYPDEPLAHFCLGKVYYESGLLDQALESFKRTEKLATQEEDLMYIYNWIGLVLKEKGDYDGAIEYYMRSLSVAKRTGDKEMQSALLNNIGGVYHSKGDLDKAISYYIESLELKEKEEDKAPVCNNIAALCYEKGDYKKAEEFLKKAIASSERAGNLRGSGAALLNLGEFYRRMKEYELARKSIEEGLERVKGDIYWTAAGYTSLGLLERDLGRYKEAIDYLKEARQLFIQAGAFLGVETVDFEIRETESLLN